MKTEKRENKNIRNYETREEYEKGDNLNHLQKQLICYRAYRRMTRKTLQGHGVTTHAVWRLSLLCLLCFLWLTWRLSFSN